MASADLSSAKDGTDSPLPVTDAPPAPSAYKMHANIMNSKDKKDFN